MNFFNTANNTTLNPALALPGVGNPTAAQLANLQNNDFGIQAGVNGQQTGLQSLLFNAPNINGQTGVGQRGGLNLDGISAIGQTLGSLGMLYNAFQQQKLAKKQFKLQEESYRTNMRNSVDSYNTSLEDRARARYHQQGQGANSAEANQYINDNELST